MNPLELLAALPQWATATPEKILASPAWTMPCRLGDETCRLRLDAVRPAETLDIAIRVGDEDHVLGIADSPTFPELHAVWASRAEVPEPILLALIEKDCGPLLQLLENAVRLQLKVVGLAKAPPRTDAQLALARVVSADGEEKLVFTLDLSTAVASVLGMLRYIDTSHQSVREATLPAETEYAAFSLPADDLASLSPGDALLLPEAGSMPPRTIVDGRFALGEGGVSPWTDGGQLRVCAAEATSVTTGTLLDACGEADAAVPGKPAAEAPLRLVRQGRTIATGRFGKVAEQYAFVTDSVV